MKSRTLVVAVFAALLAVSPAFSAEKNVSEAAKPVVEPPRSVDKMTKAEIADRITKVLDRRKEVLNFVQGLSKEKDAEGNEFYTFQGIRIAGLERAVMEKLYIRVRQEAVRINTERLTKQIESINRANQLSRAAQQLPQVPGVPRVITAPPRPPALPPVVQQTPQIPKSVPAPPPAPPRR